MPTGAKMGNQSKTDQSGGGQLVGRAPSAPIRMVPNFQGKSGQGDNQSTMRPKGSS